MSNPAVIRFWQNQQDEHPLGIYLHWGASECAKHLSIALNNTRERWDDPDYANRMAVQSILEHSDIGPVDLGAGLFTGTVSRGENLVLNVNWDAQTVWTDDWRVTFEQYINEKIWKRVQG